MAKQAAVVLTETEVMSLETILLDQDKDEALTFLREVLHPKVKASQGDHCEPWS